MRIYKDTYKAKDGEMKKTKRWYLDFFDHLNRRHKLAGFTDKKITRDLAGRIESLISYRVSGQSLPPELHRWLDDVPDAMKQKFAKWSLVDAQRIEGHKLLTVHLDDWKKSIIATGSTEKQVEQQHTRTSRVFSESGFVFWKDIQASKLLVTIESLQKTCSIKPLPPARKIPCIAKTNDAKHQTSSYYMPSTASRRLAPLRRVNYH